MGRLINKLTAKQVEKLNEAGRHSDGGNLYLSISKNGGKRWVFFYRFSGKQREMGLGSASLSGVSLAKARELASEARMHLQTGSDPLEVKKQKQFETRAVPTFGDWADHYIDTHSKSWRNDKHIAQWRMTLTKYCIQIRSKPVDKIDTEQVLNILQPLWMLRPETAQRLRGRLEKVLDAAKARGLRKGENPARWKGHLQNLLPKPRKLTRGHHAALPYDQIYHFMEELAQRESLASQALELTILTACRTGETLHARWDEFDIDNALWIIPGQRTKMEREHRVPLSDKCLMLLENLEKRRLSAYIFPSSRLHKPLSSMAMAMQLRRMNRSDITVHGFRSSFRDWAAETTAYPREVCELALAHSIASKTEAAYRRGDLLEKRRELMQEWANYCFTDPNKKLGRNDYA